MWLIYNYVRWIYFQVYARGLVYYLFAHIKALNISNWHTSLFKNEIYVVVVCNFTFDIIIINDWDVIVNVFVDGELLCMLDLDLLLIRCWRLLSGIKWVESLRNEQVIVVIFKLKLVVWFVFSWNIKFYDVWYTGWGNLTSLRE